MSESGEDRWFEMIGNGIGGLGAIIAFFAIYLAAIGSVGWVIGIALGWIPAYLGGMLTFFFLRYLWPLLLLGLLWLAGVILEG